MPPKSYRVPRQVKAKTEPSKPKAPRKQKLPPPKPEGWSNAGWASELQRRAVISGGRRKRLLAQKVRIAAVADEEATREEMVKNAAAKTAVAAKPASSCSSSVRANMRPPPPPPPPIQHQVHPPQHQQYPPMHQQLAGSYLQGMWPSQQSVASPNFSPSPEYVDGDPHGGFNPNTVFGSARPPPSNLGIDINNAYSHSPTYSGTPSPHGLRRVGLFTGSSAEMDDIITVGSNAVVADPGYMDTPDEEEGDIVALDTQTTFGEQTTQDKEEDPAPTAKGKRKRKTTSTTAEPRVKWATKEDECLVEAWMTVSIDSIINANQNGDHYWGRVKKSYDERRMLDPDFAVCTIDRGEKAMVNRWAAIQQVCNKWHGIQEEVRHRPQSGSNVEQRMVHMFDMYHRDNNDAEFKFLHVFTRIESCEKWKDVRLALAKTKDGVYNPDTPTNSALPDRLEGNKKAKAAKAGAPAAERVQAAIDQWAALMKKSDIKIELLKTNVAAKKRMTDLAFLQAGDPAMMTLQVAAWYRAECGKILNWMPAAPSVDEDDAHAEDDAQPPPSTTAVEDEQMPSPTAIDETPAPALPSATAVVDEVIDV
ncbi:unnamed protein product [Alopecurus aequalis]